MISLAYSFIGIIAVSGSSRGSSIITIGDSSIDSKDGFNSIFPPSIVPVPFNVGENGCLSLFRFLVLKADNYETICAFFDCGEATIFSCLPVMIKGSKS